MENNLRRILEAAIRSPSGDNCQPFRFKIIDSNTVQIFHNNTVALHFFNSNNFASLIALGTVIETIFIESRGLGFIASVDYTDDLGSAADLCWAIIKLTKTSMPLSENLIGAYDLRWTNRAPYRPEKLSPELIQACKIQASLASTAVEISYGKPISDDFVDYLQSTEMIIWDHKSAANDLLKMLRFPDNKNPSQFGDGISSYELGINTFQMLIMRILHFHPNLLSLFSFFGFKTIAEIVTKRNYIHSGGIIVFSVLLKENPVLAAVETGRSALRVWMFLCQQGYSVQPITSASMLCYQNQNHTLTAPMIPKYKKILAFGSSLWRKHFNIPETFHPVWSIRVGQPLQNIQRHRSKRWKLDDLILN